MYIYIYVKYQHVSTIPQHPVSKNRKQKTWFLGCHQGLLHTGFLVKFHINLTCHVWHFLSSDTTHSLSLRELSKKTTKPAGFFCPNVKSECENKFPALRYCSAFLCCSSRKSSLVRILKWMRDEWCFLSAVFDKLTEKQIRISWSTAYVSGK